MQVFKGKNNSEIRVFNQNCLDFLTSKDCTGYDLAIVDPPYGIDIDKQWHSNKGENKFKLYRKTNWDSGVPTAEYWDLLRQNSKNQIVWGGNYMTEFLPPSQGWIIWDKGQRNFTMADAELAWTSFDRAMRIFDFSRGECVAENNRYGGKTHVTQKPVSLYKYCLTKYAKEGWRILDTHGGSMTHALAAIDLGFSLDICEIDPEYYNEGVERISRYINQEVLF